MSRTGVGGDFEGSLLQLVAEVETFEGALEATLRLACTAGGWAYGEAWLPEGGELVFGVGHDPSDQFGTFQATSADATFTPGRGLVGRVFESGEVAWLDGLGDTEAFVRAEAASSADLESAVGIPIFGDAADGVVAVLAFYATQHRTAVGTFPAAVASAVATLGPLFVRAEARSVEVDERALLDEIIHTSPVGIVVHDPEGGIERANPTAASILGVDSETIVERGVDSERWDVRDEDGEPVPTEELPFAVAIRDGSAVVDRWLVVGRPAGSEVTLSVNAAPVLDEKGAVARVIVTFSDVSQRAEHEAELEEKNRQLESFASVLSHDIRSPLAVATGFLELTRETGDMTYLDKVERSHERIEALVDTLLVLARRGRMVGAQQPVDLAETARAAWAVTETKDATLDVGDVGHVEADPVRLQQVFENLFRNAVQHAGEDVAVRVLPLDDEPGFAVEDDGPGIPATKREELLRPGHESSGGGFGIGLSIVAAVAEGHEWDLRVVEGADGGARFEFRTGVPE